jgi:hypothetical protein
MDALIFFRMRESCPVDIRATDSPAAALFDQNPKLNVKNIRRAGAPGVMH